MLPSVGRKSARNGPERLERDALSRGHAVLHAAGGREAAPGPRQGAPAAQPGLGPGPAPRQRALAPQQGQQREQLRQRLERHSVRRRQAEDLHQRRQAPVAQKVGHF